MSESLNIHATGLVLGGTGLILRGPSGSGKSLLALDLLEQWEARGRPALLVSDDRVEIVAEGGELTMRPAPNIEGLIELRGRGIVRRPFAAAAKLHLVIDLVETLERMLEEDVMVTELGGVSVSRAPVPRAGVIDARHQLLLIREAIAAVNAPRRRGGATKNHLNQAAPRARLCAPLGNLLPGRNLRDFGDIA